MGSRVQTRTSYIMGTKSKEIHGENDSNQSLLFIHWTFLFYIEIFVTVCWLVLGGLKKEYKLKSRSFTLMAWELEQPR